MDGMSGDELENYESEMELQLYREYRDVVGLFRYVVETERRFYLANAVDVTARAEGGEVFFEVLLEDAWVRVLSFKDVNVEELPPRDDLQLPQDGPPVT